MPPRPVFSVPGVPGFPTEIRVIGEPVAGLGLAEEPEEVDMRCESLANSLAERDQRLEIKLSIDGVRLVRAALSGRGAERLANLLAERDQRGEIQLSDDELELVRCLLGPSLPDVLPTPPSSAAEVPVSVPSPPVETWVLELHCGSARDCVGGNRYYPTEEAATAAAGTWVATGGGRYFVVRPLRPGEFIQY